MIFQLQGKISKLESQSQSGGNGSVSGMNDGNSVKDEFKSRSSSASIMSVTSYSSPPNRHQQIQSHIQTYELEKEKPFELANVPSLELLVNQSCSCCGGKNCKCNGSSGSQGLVSESPTPLSSVGENAEWECFCPEFLTTTTGPCVSDMAANELAEGLWNPDWVSMLACECRNLIYSFILQFIQYLRQLIIGTFKRLKKIQTKN
jgi:hypothetical protein